MSWMYWVSYSIAITGWLVYLTLYWRERKKRLALEEIAESAVKLAEIVEKQAQAIEKMSEAREAMRDYIALVEEKLAVKEMVVEKLMADSLRVDVEKEKGGGEDEL